MEKVREKVEEKILVEISKDKMLGVISFIEEENEGDKLTLDEIKREIKNAGIVAGIDEEALQKISQSRRYNHKYLIARGIPAKDGEDGQLEFLFDKNCCESSFTPSENEDGTVDFKNLDIIKLVEKDQTLVKASPPTEGEDGKDVHGKDIKARDGREARFPRGKNIYIVEDARTLHSSIEGQILYKNGVINITETHTVEGDAGVATGNIDFPGNVLIRGNVESGFTIKAGGNVEVEGYVEEAVIIAGGDIVLRHGIQGKNNGKLVAGGDIITKFIQSSIVEAQGCLYTEAIMHSRVEAGDSVIVDANKGLIVGGSVQATNLIKAKTVGSPMSTVTKVQISMPLSTQHKYNKVEKDLQAKRKQLEQINKNVVFIQKKLDSGEKLTPKLMGKVDQLIQLQGQLKREVFGLDLEYKSLSKTLADYRTGNIKVKDVIHPGVRILIGKYIRYIKDEVNYANIFIENKDIKFDSY